MPEKNHELAADLRKAQTHLAADQASYAEDTYWTVGYAMVEAKGVQWLGSLGGVREKLMEDIDRFVVTKMRRNKEFDRQCVRFMSLELLACMAEDGAL